MEAKDQQQPHLGLKFVSMIGHSLQKAICVMVFVLMQRFPIYAISVKVPDTLVKDNLIHLYMKYMKNIYLH